MVPKMVRMGVLYDIYGSLLTARQRKVIDLHYNNDFSLGEIAEQLGISRQAVYDGLKQAEEMLEGYESKLKLAQRLLKRKRDREGILNEINELWKLEERKDLKDRLWHLKRRIRSLIEV